MGLGREQNTFYNKRTHSIAKEHISLENKTTVWGSAEKKKRKNYRVKKGKKTTVWGSAEKEERVHPSLPGTRNFAKLHSELK